MMEIDGPSHDVVVQGTPCEAGARTPIAHVILGLTEQCCKVFWLEFFRQGLAALSLFSSSLFRDKALHVNGLCSILIGDSEQCGYPFCGSGVPLRRTGISFRRRPQGLRLVSEFTWKPCA